MRGLAAWLIAFALLVSGASFAEEPETHLARERRLAASGQYEEAIRSARESAALLADQEGDARQVLPYLLNDVARWEWALRRMEPALASAREAVEEGRRVYGPTARQLPYLLRDLAFFEFSAGDCSAAGERYQLAYDIAARHEDWNLLADVSVSLAELRQQTGDLAGAREVTEDLLRRSNVSTEAQLRARWVNLHLALDSYAVDSARSQLADIESIRSKDPNLAARTEESSILARARLARMSGDFAGAERLLRSRLSAGAASGSSALQAELAVLQGLLGRYADAESLYREVLSAMVPGTERSLPSARTHYGLAWVNRMLGDSVLSEAHFKRAIDGFRACTGGKDWRTAIALIERSRLYLQMGRITQALADAEAAAVILQDMPGDWPIQRAHATAARSFALARLGRLDDSRAAMLSALQQIEAVRGPLAEDLAPGQVHLAELSVLEGNAGDVRRWAEKALAIRERTGAVSLWGTGTALSMLAAASAMDGAIAQYAGYAEKFRTAVVEYLALAPGAGTLAASEVRNSRTLFERVLEPLDKLDAAALDAILPTGIALMQLSQLSESGIAVRVTGRAGNSTGADLLSRRLELTEQWHALHSQFSQIQLNSQGDSPLAESLAGKLAETRSQLVAVEKRLMQVSPEIADLVRPAAIEVADIQRLLDAREALLLQFVSDSSTQHVLITSGGVSYRSSPLGRSVVRRHVSRLRRALDLALPLQDRLAFDEKAAHELYVGSVGLFSEALEGIERLTVVADDAFQNIPWGVLRMNRWDAGESKYLAERLSVAVVPSAATFRLLRTRADTERASEPFIGFGDPALSGRPGTDVRSVESLAEATVHGSNAEAVMSLTALPQTAAELREMARILGADAGDVFTGAAATKSAVLRSNLEKYRVISFATHGLLAGEFRGLSEPALVLTPATGKTADDGLLRASDIAQLRLDADLVILSACNTGRAEGDGGAYGLSGLARAFFAAGARSMVVSHWAVSSAATVPLLTKSLRLMREQPGLSKSEALKQAMLWMKSGGAGEQFTAPAFWAPFVVMGDDRPLREGG